MGASPGVALLALLLAALASPARADGLFGSRSDPARLRFGLGLDTFFEHQESLRITSMESAIAVRDLANGSEESGVLHGDPGLLNRKFDILWEMAGAGVEVPLGFSLWGGLAHSTLVLRAATADVTLDFHDRTRAQDSSSLAGRGTLLGAEVNVVAALCRACPWLSETSYGFQKLPHFAVDRSPGFDPEGFEVLEDEVRLGREVQEIAARIGYGFTGDRVTAYTGVLHRWTDLRLEDELRYRDPLQATETRLSSRTELESEATLALAGVDYRNGRRFHGRLETSLGEEDWGVTVKVVYRTEPQLTRKEIDAFALSVVQQLARLEADFRQRRAALTVVPGGPEGKAYLAAEVEGLLDSTEARLLEILHPQELAPVRDSLQLRFRRFREALGSIQRLAGTGQPTPGARPGIALAAYRLAQAGPDRALPSNRVVAILDGIGELLLRATGLASNGDFTLRLCVDSLPRDARFRMWTQKYKGPEGKTVKPETTVARGRYSYRFSFKRDTPPKIECPEDEDDLCLDLWESHGDQMFECNFQTQECELRPMPPQGCRSR